MSITRSVRAEASRNERGSAEARRRRRVWLLETYRADHDLFAFIHDGIWWPVAVGKGEPACRCYRCGELLSLATLTVDRIIPGCQGGTYRRTNVRPACFDCNNETGQRVRGRK